MELTINGRTRHEPNVPRALKGPTKHGTGRASRVTSPCSLSLARLTGKWPGRLAARRPTGPAARTLSAGLGAATAASTAAPTAPPGRTWSGCDVREGLGGLPAARAGRIPAER